jgi:hypothetical protein
MMQEMQVLPHLKSEYFYENHLMNTKKSIKYTNMAYSEVPGKIPGRPREGQSTEDYLKELGYAGGGEGFIATNWDSDIPPTMKQVEKGRKWEEDNRLRTAKTWAEDLEK